MILCIGTTPTAQRSLTFPRLTLDSVNRATEVSEYASGKSINVARILRILNQSPLCTGFLGGPRGDLIRQDLTALSIPHDFVQVTPPTRLCTTVIDRATNTATELVEESAPLPDSAWPALDAKVAALAPTAQVAVLSGSLPPGAPQNAYARWTRLLPCPTILDTRGTPLKSVLSQENVGDLYVKMNSFELAETSNERVSSSLDELKRQMIAFHKPRTTLIITLGKDGALATQDGSSLLHVSTPPITPVSAIGSGDSFAAGLAAALHEKLPFENALTLAAACGTANALTDRAGHLHPADLARILAQTSVRPI